ncbi:hypothetical protein Tco_1143292, partial [Tanacetum coccineum]
MGRITRLQLQAVYAEYEALELRDFWVTDRLKILELHNRAEYAETRLEWSHDRPTGDGVRTKRAVMTEREVEAQRARAEAVETITTINQGLSFAEIEHIVAMRVASAIEKEEIGRSPQWKFKPETKQRTQ